MAYNKTVWVSGAVITSALLNNIEDEVDAIADLAYTFAGAKKFTTDPEVEKSDAGIRLDDTDGDGTDFTLRSKSGNMEIYDHDGAGPAMTDIVTHQHGGTVDGLAVDYPDLTTRTHSEEDHINRVQSVYIPGKGMHPSYQHGTSAGLAGPQMRDAQTDDAYANLVFNITGEKWLLGANRNLYGHFMSDAVGSGDIVLDISAFGIDDGDTGPFATLLSRSNIVFSFTAGGQFKRFTLATTLDLSTEYDLFLFYVKREGAHGSDDLTGNVFLTALEVSILTDQ